MKTIGKIEAAALIARAWIHAYSLKAKGTTDKKVKIADAAIPHFSRMFKALPENKQSEVEQYASEQLVCRTPFKVGSVTHRGALQALSLGRFAWSGRGVDERLFPVLGDVGKKIVREFCAERFKK